MKNVLAIAAMVEAATGLALLVSPPLVVWLLFGVEVEGVSIVIGRVTGISLIALGLACWPGPDRGRGDDDQLNPLRGMLAYSLLATIYLGYVGIASTIVGQVLWAAVAAHAVITVLLARGWIDRQTSASSHIEMRRENRASE